MIKKVMIPLFVVIGIFCLGAARTAHAVKPPTCDNDGICERGEDSSTCPNDCGAPSVCGDGTCAPDESCSSCEADCGICPPPVCNGDGICNLGEDCVSCPTDCLKYKIGKTWYCCGLDTCDEAKCGAGCGTPIPEPGLCGDGIPDAGEECDDGNQINTDACLNTCVAASCGDGFVYAGVEECDDGNTNPGDGCDASCMIEQAVSSVPLNQYNVGDSIGEGEAAYGSNFLCIPTNIGDQNHDIVWSTGYNSTVNSINLRHEAKDAAAYYANDATRDAQFNRAISGNVMADFARQAQEIVNEATARSQPVGQISMLLGNNDVCGSSVSLSTSMTPQQKYDAVVTSMTDRALYADQMRAALDILAASPLTKDAFLHVSGVPAIYWLWEAKRSATCCTNLIWPNVPCQNLLANSGNDCVTDPAAPDTIDYVNDGLNCQRRKIFHKVVRDEFNALMQTILMNEYVATGKLQNAYFVDIYGTRFFATHVNNGDCFHPSVEGHRLLADEEYCSSLWGLADPACLL